MLSPINFYTLKYQSNIAFRRNDNKNKTGKTNIPAKSSMIDDKKLAIISAKRGNMSMSDTLLTGQFYLFDNYVFNRKNTALFRPDFDWRTYGEYLSERFKDCKKVNTYVYACSDGSEAYTLSMLLQHKFKDEADKFFPIRAKDINKTEIENNIYGQSKDRIYVDARVDFDPYYAALKVFQNDNPALATGEDELNKFMIRATMPNIYWVLETAMHPVEFEFANILEDIDNIDTSNPCIIMCRNMWPYVEEKEHDNFAQKLYDKLPKGSIVVLGEYDYGGETWLSPTNSFPDSLLRAGFTTLPDELNYPFKLREYVFEKNK